MKEHGSRYEYNLKNFTTKIIADKIFEESFENLKEVYQAQRFVEKNPDAEYLKEDLDMIFDKMFEAEGFSMDVVQAKILLKFKTWCPDLKCITAEDLVEAMREELEKITEESVRRSINFTPDPRF